VGKAGFFLTAAMLPAHQPRMVENMQKQWTDDRLTAEAESGLRGQGALVEAMRRLRESVDRFSTSSDTYARRMLWLTIAIGILTLVQVVVAFKP
jgi:hypothetical protein